MTGPCAPQSATASQPAISPASAAAGLWLGALPGLETRCYRPALVGLDGIMTMATSAMTPISERLATCARIGPEWV